MAHGNLIASTMTFRTYPIKEVFVKLMENGFDEVELCSVGEWVPHFNFTDKNEVDLIYKAVEETGMKVYCINIGAENIDNENKPIAKNIDGLRNAFELAQRIGAGFVTYACGTIKPEMDKKMRLDAITSFNNTIADIADEYGVIYAIEAPHKLSISEQPDDLHNYWDMQDKRIKCTFDTAHLTYAGADTIKEAKLLAQRIIHVHLRDAVKGNSLLSYGEGVVDFGTIINTLKDSGYKGKFSMEYPADSNEEAIIKIKKSIEYLSKFNI